MEDRNRKKVTMLSEDELDKVAGGTLTDKVCPFCSNRGFIEYIGYDLYQCMVCKREFNARN